MSAASEIQYVWFVIELLRSRKRNRERDASRTAEMERQKARNKKRNFNRFAAMTPSEIPPPVYIHSARMLRRDAIIRFGNEIISSLTSLSLSPIPIFSSSSVAPLHSEKHGNVLEASVMCSLLAHAHSRRHKSGRESSVTESWRGPASLLHWYYHARAAKIHGNVKWITCF